MSIFDAIIQGIVQGLTEFLPVSSSGHLLLSQHVLGMKENNLFFNVMLHLGTLIAVIFVYYKLLISLIKNFFILIYEICTGKFDFNKLNKNKKMVIMLICGLMPLFLLFIPVYGTNTNIKGLAEKFSDNNNIILVGVSLIITSILLYIGTIKIKNTKNFKNNFNISDSFFIGLIQCVAAVFPGLSRSGSTLSAGLMRNIDKQTILDYSFIMGIPAILAAAILEFKEFSKSSNNMSIDLTSVIIGVLVSAIIGFLSIKLFKILLKTNKIKIFVVYTCILGFLSIIIGILEKILGVNLFTGVPI